MHTVVKPIPEGVETVLHQVLCGSKVEPWINCSIVSAYSAILLFQQLRHTLMDNALKPNHRKQSARNRGSCNGTEDDQAKQATRVPPRLALEEEVGRILVAVGGDGHGEGCLGMGGGGGEAQWVAAASNCQSPT